MSDASLQITKERNKILRDKAEKTFNNLEASMKRFEDLILKIKNLK